MWRSLDRDIQWVYAPKELGYKERGGIATIFRFSADHVFTLVYDTIYQQNGHENASAGDSWSIYYGTWREENGRILISYSPAYVDIPRVVNGRMVCDPPVQDRPIAFVHEYIAFGKEKLKRAPQLQASVDKLFQLSTNFHPNNGSCGNYANGQPFVASKP